MDQIVDEDADLDQYTNVLEPQTLIFRLLTGEDIIAQSYDIRDESNMDDANHYIVVEPLKLVFYQNQDTGGMSLAFMQWVFRTVAEEQVYKIYLKDILTVIKPRQSLIDGYVKYILSAIDSEKRVITKTESSHPSMNVGNPIHVGNHTFH